MKKWVKTLLITGGSLLAAGIVIMIVGFGALGWDMNKLDANEYVAKTYETQSEQKITRVQLNVSSFPVIVINGDSVKLDYYEATDSTVSVIDEDGVLKVTETHKYNPFKSGIFNLRGNRKFVLSVGPGVELDLDGSNGNIEFNDFESENLDLDITNTFIVFKDCAVESFSLTASNADIELDGCRFGTATVNATNCDLTARGVGGDSLTVLSTNFDGEFYDVDFGSLALNSTNMDVKLSGCRCGKTTATATNLGIDLLSVEVDGLDIRGTNLDADIKIIGVREQYTIETHGSNMPTTREGSTDKYIKLSGTNNDVSLIFV